jgi:hypothetical protein
MFGQRIFSAFLGGVISPGNVLDDDSGSDEGKLIGREQ